MSLMLDDVKYFIKVSETLNITRASEIIGISQPALSYAMKRLETELGGQLMIRLKNGVQLTKLGEEFQQRARRLVHEWEQARNLAISERGLIQGNYIIAAHPSVTLYTFEHFIPQLQLEFPKIDFRFIHGLSREMTEKVISWEADFGIVVNPIQHPDLVISHLYGDEVTLFHTENATKKLIYDPNLTQSQYIIKHLAHKSDFKGDLHSANLELVAKLASLGVGYGLLPSRIAYQYPQLKKLKNAPLLIDEICLIYRPDKHRNMMSQKIIDTIKIALRAPLE